MLEEIKLLLGIKDNEQDGLLSLLISKSTGTVLNYTRRTQLIKPLESVVVDLAVIAHNRMGAEGEQGRSEGGVSHTFYVSGDDLPKSIREQMQRYAVATVIGA